MIGFGVGQMKAESVAVFIIASVIGTTNVVTFKAQFHPVVQKSVVYTHRVEPTVQCCAIMVKTQLLLHRQPEIGRQAHFKLGRSDAAKVGCALALGKGSRNRKKQHCYDRQPFHSKSLSFVIVSMVFTSSSMGL